jgi:hypothetical protein
MRVSKLVLAAVPLAGALSAGLANAAVIYPGNGGSGFGGVVGNGSVTVSDSATSANVTFTFNPSGGFTGNDLVLYIDTVPGGYSDTSTLIDASGGSDGGEAAASGENVGGGTRTVASFPAGFGADFALGFENNVYTALYSLGAGGSINYQTGGAPPGGGPYTITIPDSTLGITPGSSLSFVGTLTSTSAYRSNETIGLSATVPDGSGSAPNAGFNGQTIFAADETYTTAGVPEPVSLGLVAVGSMALLGRRRAIRA